MVTRLDNCRWKQAGDWVHDDVMASIRYLATAAAAAAESLKFSIPKKSRTSPAYRIR